MSTAQTTRHTSSDGRRFFATLVFALVAGMAWGAPHKVRVADPAIARLLIDRGGRLISDYGSFQVVETDDAQPAITGLAQLESEDNSDVIELNTQPLNTREPQVRALRRNAGVFVGKRLHLVHFAGPIKPEWRAALEQHGARIVSYVPNNAYLVYGDAPALGRMQSWANATNAVQWDGNYADEYKIHPGARVVTVNGLPQTPATDTFAVQLVDDADANGVTLALIDQLKLEPVKRQFRTLDYLNLIVRLPPDRVGDVAARPEVISIQPYVEPQLRDERQDQIVAGNLSGSSPSGPGYLAWLASKGFTQTQFTTSGFAVDVSDSGIDNGTATPGHFGLYQSGNPAQASRVVYNRLVGTPHSGSTIQGCDGHGNLNSHIIAGYNDFPAGFPHTDASGFHYGLGVCPFVKVGSSVIFDPSTFTSPNYANLQSQAYHDGARVSANSWGANVAGAYNVDSQSYDALVRDAQPTGSTFATSGNQQMVIVFAAGNAGSGAQTVGSPGTAKNIITVGASENVHSHSIANGGNDASGSDRCAITDAGADNANDIASFSSRGPCADGRKKPDLVAPGTHVTGGVAQASTNTSGTGQAISCFVASGVCALIGAGTAGNANNFFPLGQQFFTTSSGTSHSTPAVAGACALLRQYFINNSLAAPSPAMTKASLMNSTRYLTGVSANDTLWSGNQGMGELNLGTAFDGTPRVLRDQLSADKFTATGQTRVFTGVINDTTKPFRVTLAWTDAPGNTTGNAFNNDLDLTVTVGGVTYKGNVFSGAFSIAGGTADAKNNVENVFLPANTSGNYVVTITAANIPSDGVPNEAPSTDQDFALVIYNATEVLLPTIAPSGYALSSEGCNPPNGGVDPDETVTVNFALTNSGPGATANLVATLLQGNGVVAPSGVQNYGALTAGGGAVSRPFTFTASGACGGTISAVLQLQDGASNFGMVTQNVTLGWTGLLSSSRTNTTSISIPASGTSGSGSPYPSTISVSGVNGTVQKVTVMLFGLSHTNPDDIDVLLVGPGGQKLLLMSDCGGSPDISNVTLTFDDGAASSLPNSSTISSGTFKPTNNDTSSDTFPSPAPGSPYSSTLSVFNGVDPNGTWLLYINDDASSGSGSLAQGWALTFTTSNLVCCSSTADLAVSNSAAPSQINAGSNVTFSVSITNRGPDPAIAATLSDTLSPGLSFVSASSSQGTCSNYNNLVTCTLGTMPNAAFATVTINATAINAGMLTNNASVSSVTSDHATGNNTTAATVSVNAFPTISSLSNQTTSEDVPTAAIGFVISDAETVAGALSLTKDSTDTNLVPLASIVFGGSGSNRTVTITPAPNLSGTATITITVSDGQASANGSFLLTVNPVNDPPVLAAISNYTVTEGNTLTFTASATDVEAPPQTLTFSVSNAPSGAIIGPSSGAFSWTPDESQGPATNSITVVVTDNGSPNKSDARTFTVVVLETNSAPVLSPIPNQIVLERELLVITNVASDSDIPANVLTFSLEGSVPAGATIDSASGVFAWTPPVDYATTTTTITVRVTDNGVPAASDAKAFNVAVVVKPGLVGISESPEGLFSLQWQVQTGRTYQFQYKNSLVETNWTNLGEPYTAASSIATIIDDPGTNRYRFYRALDITSP